MKTIMLLLTILLLRYNALAQGKWYFNSSLQTVGSKYDDGSSHNSFFLYNGITYQSGPVYLNFNFPLVVTSSNTFTQIENTFIPNNHMGRDSRHWFNGFPHMSDSEGRTSDSPAFGIGDFYINASYELIKEKNILPSFSLDGYIKLPTASDKLGIGTGEYDYQIALGAKKYLSGFMFYAQLGYLFLGKIEGTEISNPLTFSAGAAYILDNKKHSFYIGYDSYSTIIQGTSSPKQLGFGYNYLINQGLLLNTILSIGLNSSTSDYIFSIGLNKEI